MCRARHSSICPATYQTPRRRSPSPCRRSNSWPLALGAAGVGPGTLVVAYSTTDADVGDPAVVDAARGGFDNAAVLDGGFDKWRPRDVRSKPASAAIRRPPSS